ncbi:MAG: response regulator transcription factor [Cyanobacteria bacterium P01_F01_bin.13]
MASQTSPHPIRILIVDDHPVVRNGLAMMLKYEPGMALVAEASNGQEAVELFGQHQPDVTLMDLRMPGMGGVDAILTIRQEFSDARFIILTTYDGDEDIYRGLQAGAKAYLLKDAPCEELLAAIRKVYGGKSHIPTEVGAKLAERMQCENLSAREIEVVQLMAQGKSNREIGEVLKITEGTVKYHVNNILSKLQVHDRTQAVITALKRGIASL